jgi:hypothetical protein
MIKLTNSYYFAPIIFNINWTSTLAFLFIDIILYYSATNLFEYIGMNKRVELEAIMMNVPSLNKLIFFWWSLAELEILSPFNGFFKSQQGEIMQNGFFFQELDMMEIFLLYYIFFLSDIYLFQYC